MAKIRNPIPTVNEKLLARYIRHAVYLEQLKKGEASLISRFLGQKVFPSLSEKLINELSKIKNLETLGSIRKIPVKRLTRMMLAVRKTAQVGAVKAEKMLVKRLVNISRFEADWNADIISKTVPFDLDMTMPSSEVLKQLAVVRPFDGHKLSTWMKGYSKTIQISMVKQIRTGIASGESLPNIGARINKALNWKGKQAQYIARTAVSNVVHQAKEEVFKKNTDIVRKVQWVSTLDDRTSMQCIHLDGRMFDIGDGPRPPAHFNCRSTVIPITPSWQEYGVVDPPPATRASMNGAVPAKMTYKQWIKKQPKAVQVKVLGKKRAELYRTGQVKIDRFVGKDLRPLNLKQLARREGLDLRPVPEIKALSITTVSKGMNADIDDIIKKTPEYKLPLECHQNVKILSDKYGKQEGVKYYHYDESKSDKIIKLLDRNKVVSQHPEVQDLIGGIEKGWVNGHSFIKVGNKYIDPYLRSLNVPQLEINQVDNYLAKIYESVQLKIKAKIIKVSKPTKTLLPKSATIEISEQAKSLIPKRLSVDKILQRRMANIDNNVLIENYVKFQKKGDITNAIKMRSELATKKIWIDDLGNISSKQPKTWSWSDAPELKLTTIDQAPIVKTTFAKTTSADIRKLVDDTIDAYPEKVKVALNKNGTSYNIGNSLTEINPELKGKHPISWSRGATWDNVGGMYNMNTKSVSIAETYLPRGKKFYSVHSNNQIRRTLNHETGHAFDSSDITGMIYSNQQKFKAAYTKDVNALSRTTRVIDNNLQFFIQPGGIGRSEVFADVFGDLMGEGVRKEISKFFPNCKEYIEDLLK